MQELSATTGLLDKGGTVYNVKAYGAKGNGSTDDTTAITNALAAGGITYFPAGTYLHTGLTLPTGAHLLGVGAGLYGTATSTSQRSILKMKNATNANSLTIAAGSSYGVIENLEIDGNKANQTTAGKGIVFNDAVSAEECGWELKHVELYNTWDTGIYVGSNRQAVYGEHVIVTASGAHGIQILGSDSTWIKPMVGSSAFKNIVVQASMTRLIGGDIWSGSDYGIVVVSHDVVIQGVGIDHNQFGGLLLDTGADSVSIVACDFHSNSQAANNTYSDIKVNVSGNYSIIGSNFGALDSGITNKRKYAIEVGSNTAIVASNTHITGATATDFTDTPGNIGQRTYSRIGSTTSGTSITVNSDNYDQYDVTALAANIGTFTISGTPTHGQKLMITIKGAASQTIATPSNVVNSGVASWPTTTVAGKYHEIGLKYNSPAAKFVVLAADATGY